MSGLERLVHRVTTNRKLPLSLRRQLARRFIPMDGRRFELELDGRRFIGRCDNYIEWLVYATGSYFEYTYINLVRSLVQEAAGGGRCADAALDIGANVGNHSHAFAGIFAEVHAFEPLAPLADRLEEQVSTLPHVRVHRLALGEHPATLRFEPSATANWGKGRISDAGTLEVPVVAGDEYLAGRVTRRIAFIKIDVEGHEVPVLRGLQRTLARDRPLVMFELPRAMRQVADGGLSVLRGLFPEGYEFIGLGGQTTFPIQAEVARTTPIPRASKRLPRGFTNLIALPREASAGNAAD
jgi:FkbM family methyltransferase